MSTYNNINYEHFCFYIKIYIIAMKTDFYHFQTFSLDFILYKYY
jgi:hypothetical protein